eukprot:5477325-Prymnesium_polylepis.1
MPARVRALELARAHPGDEEHRLVQVADGRVLPADRSRGDDRVWLLAVRQAHEKVSPLLGLVGVLEGLRVQHLAVPPYPEQRPPQR